MTTRPRNDAGDDLLQHINQPGPKDDRWTSTCQRRHYNAPEVLNDRAQQGPR